jgi:hypothetical protein
VKRNLEAALRDRAGFEKTALRLASELEQATQQLSSRDADVAAATRASKAAQQALERAQSDLVAAESREATAVEEADAARRALSSERLRLDRGHNAALDALTQERDTALATLEGVRYETSRELKALRAAVATAERLAADAGVDRDHALAQLAHVELRLANASAAVSSVGGRRGDSEGAAAALSPHRPGKAHLGAEGSPDPSTKPVQKAPGSDVAIAGELAAAAARIAKLEAALHESNTAIQVSSLSMGWRLKRLRPALTCLVFLPYTLVLFYVRVGWAVEFMCMGRGAGGGVAWGNGCRCPLSRHLSTIGNLVWMPCAGRGGRNSQS